MLSAVLFIVYFVHVQCKSVTAWYNVCMHPVSPGEKGFTALSTNPVVLCCDLKLKPGERQSCECHVIGSTDLAAV